jgi:hypothetical protein
MNNFEKTKLCKMRIQKTAFILFYIAILLVACNAKIATNNNMVTNAKELTKAEFLLSESIKAHGGVLYDTAHYSFVFRGIRYEFKNAGTSFEYTKFSKTNTTTVKDVLMNENFIRMMDNDTLLLDDKTKKAATGAINSVIYFATLPHKLNDASVIKKIIGETIIDNEHYSILGITFQKEGGGEDFDDQFHYWINKKTNKIDYLAYSYNVNGGGIRFRSAYNRRVIDGITFQDYINYEVKLGTPLNILGNLYESGVLKELSRIDTENVIHLKQ